MRVYKILIFLLLSLIYLKAEELVLTEEEKAFVKTNPVLRVQNKRKCSPIDFREKGKTKGYRYSRKMGAEEFLIILTGTDLENAAIAAEKFRIKINESDFNIDEPVTASFGVAEFNVESDDGSSILTRVDNNLYRAKETCRNKVVSA